jgi:hypothetical protein
MKTRRRMIKWKSRRVLYDILLELAISIDTPSCERCSKMQGANNAFSVVVKWQWIMPPVTWTPQTATLAPHPYFSPTKFNVTNPHPN